MQWSNGPRSRRLAVCSTLSLVLLTLSSCKHETQQPQAAQANVLAGPAVQSETISPRIFIDGTASMTGFLRVGRNQFAEVVEQLPFVVPGAEVFRYGQQDPNGNPPIESVIQPVAIDQGLLTPPATELYYNPDDRLIEELILPRSSGVSVLVTDGVYSTVTGQYAPVVVSALKHWFEDGGSLAIFMFRSSFGGRFYSERERRMIESNTKVDRPFYLFAFSRSRADLQHMSDELVARFPRKFVTMVFAEDALSCKALPLQTSDGGLIDEDKERLWLKVDSDAFVENGLATIAASISCKTDVYYPVNVTVRPKVTYKRRNGPNEVDADEREVIQSLTKLPPQVRADPIAKHLRQVTHSMKLVVKRDEGQREGTYTIALVPANDGLNQLRPFIERLSATSDATADMLSRTYRWNDFVRSVADTHFEVASRRFSTAEASVTLEYR
jgi:hypothetical protein